MTVRPDSTDRADMEVDTKVANTTENDYLRG